jgi:hypothetical protein
MAGSSKKTTDHTVIRQWVKERGELGRFGKFVRRDDDD